jgi:hypothetical protein
MIQSANWLLAFQYMETKLNYRMDSSTPQPHPQINRNWFTASQFFKIFKFRPITEPMPALVPSRHFISRTSSEESQSSKAWTCLAWTCLRPFGHTGLIIARTITCTYLCMYLHTYEQRPCFVHSSFSWMILEPWLCKISFVFKTSSCVCMSEAGWPDEFAKESPKIKPNPLLLKLNNNFYRRIKYPKNLGYFYHYRKVNNRPMGENRHNLVTLIWRPPCSSSLEWDRVERPSDDERKLDRRRI